MTADSIREMRAAHNKVGSIVFDKSGTLHSQGMMKESLSEAEAKQEIEWVWNELGRLLDEVAQLAEDHARMTHTLAEINEKVIDAMQGTSRSSIAEDWWSVVLDEDANG